MERFEDKSLLIDASSTQRDASQGHYRRTVASLNRLNQANIGDARRDVARIEATIANFGKTILELEGWIGAERSDASTLANSLTQRRDTLKRSIEELKRKLAETRSFA